MRLSRLIIILTGVLGCLVATGSCYGSPLQESNGNNSNIPSAQYNLQTTPLRPVADKERVTKNKGGEVTLDPAHKNSKNKVSENKPMLSNLKILNSL